MQLARQPLAIAAVAAVVLIGNVAELVSRDEAGVSAGDDRDAASEPADGSTTNADGSTTNADGTITNADGTTTDGSSSDDGSGTAAPDADGGGTAVAEPQPVAALTTPAAGSYVYDSSGTWQLTGDVLHQLPDSAEATVESSGSDWTLRIAAGSDYADSFGFGLDGDGMDWMDWSLERTFFGSSGTTVYACSSVEPYHVADNAAERTIQHGCTESSQGLTSSGPVRTVGVESLQLSEGQTVEVVHLRYEYTVSSENCEGGGTLDQWLDRTTGMRVQEFRTIRSTCKAADGVAQTYDESVRFTLRSTIPA